MRKIKVVVVVELVQNAEADFWLGFAKCYDVTL